MRQWSRCRTDDLSGPSAASCLRYPQVSNRRLVDRLPGPTGPGAGWDVTKILGTFPPPLPTMGS